MNATTPAAKSSLAGATVLVVDDDERDLSWMSAALRGEGCRVLEAGSGEEGLMVFEDHEGEVDVLLADLSMPGMDGVEFVQNVRRRSPRPKVIFVSGYRSRWSGGADQDHFFEKSADSERLVQKVREVLDGKGPALSLLNMVCR